MKLFIKKHSGLLIAIFFVVINFLQNKGDFYIPLFRTFSVVSMAGLSLYMFVKISKSNNQYEIMTNIAKLLMFGVLPLVFIAQENFSKIPLQIILIVISLLFWFLLFKKQKNEAITVFVISNILMAVLKFYY